MGIIIIPELPGPGSSVMPIPIPQKPKMPGKWGKASKQLSFWVLLVLLAGTLFTYMSGAKESAPEISYSQYNQELQRGNVANVNIQSGQLITGEFRNKVQIANRPAGKFTVLLPMLNSDREVLKLEAKNLEGVFVQSRDFLIGQAEAFDQFDVAQTFGR